MYEFVEPIQAFFGLALAAIGIGMQAAGAIGASSAASDSAKAQKRGAALQQANTKKQNEVYAKQAEAAAKTAREAADIQTATATDSNKLRKEFVDKINASRAKAVDAQNLQADASTKAEGERFKQMKLENLRNRKEIMRNAQYARSAALTGATASGAERGSGLQGGFAQILGDKGSQLLGEFQNFAIGKSIFQANLAYTQAGSLVNFFQAEMATLTSLGESELSSLSATSQAKLAQTEARGADRNAGFQKQIFGLQTKADAISSNTNVKVGAAQTKQVTYNGLASLGSSIQGAGASLFKK